MFRNPKLYEHLKAAAKAASDLIKNEMPNSQQMEDLLKREPSVASCVRYLMEDTSIERLNCIKNPEEKTEEITQTVVHHVKNYLGNPYIEGTICIGGEEEEIVEMHAFKEFNEQSFNVYYEEYEKFLYSSSPIKYCIVAPLENFDYVSSPSTPAIISDNVRILSNKNAPYLHMTEKIWDEDPNYDTPEFLLEIDYEMEREKVPSKCEEHIERIALEKVREVLKVLRLYKEGDLSVGWRVWVSKTPCDPPYNKDILLYFMGNFVSDNKYSLQEDDVEGLCQLLKKYLSFSDKNAFHRTINYFNRGLIEDNSKLKLLSFIGALESFLATEKQEITYRLAISTAFFLRENRQESYEIFQDIKKAYSLRSNIVHGKLQDVDEFELAYEEYAKKTERYVRQAIILWLDKGCPKAKDIHKEIESKLFGM